MNILIVEMEPGEKRKDRWWKKYVDSNHHYDVINVFNDKSLHDFLYKKRGEIIRYVKIGIKILSQVINSGYKYDYIVSFQCGRETFIISAFQTLFNIRKPRHIILDFIMREKTNTLKSILKYAMLKYCFKSVYKVVCSSNKEKEYYKEKFEWNDDKVVFVPLYVLPEFFEIETHSGNYIFSAGRTFRDYSTLIESLRNIKYNTIILGGKNDYEKFNEIVPPHITMYKDLSFKEYIDLLANAKFVVIPLQDKIISTGQSVMLHAMALGKMVIATNTSGTSDYIEEGLTGVLVKPNSINDMEEKISYYIKNYKLIEQIGKRAKFHACNYLPGKYINELYCKLECKAEPESQEDSSKMQASVSRDE